MTEPDIPQLVAHRGIMQSFPENTWRGLELAIQAGTCWLEIDVQMCRENHFVVVHDIDLRRTSGKSGQVFELKPAELAAISVHEPARFGTRFRPQPLLTLEQVLERLRPYPQVRLMVEIKEQSLQHWGLERVMESLIDFLQKNRQQCVLISFSESAVTWTQDNSDLEAGWVLHTYDQARLQRASEINPAYLICNYKKIPSGDLPHTGNWQWMLYDITDPELAMQWAARGVELIETADIDNMLQHPLLARRRCW